MIWSAWGRREAGVPNRGTGVARPSGHDRGEIKTQQDPARGLHGCNPSPLTHDRRVKAARGSCSVEGGRSPATAAAGSALDDESWRAQNLA